MDKIKYQDKNYKYQDENYKYQDENYKYQDENTKYQNKNIKYPYKIENTDVDQMKQLWRDVFGDSQTYINLFFEKVFNPELSFIAKQGNSVVASLYMIEYSFFCNNVRYKILYLYALATRINFRNQGIMSKLIENANSYALKHQYHAMFLIPANRNLIPFYNSLGFCTFIQNESIKINNPSDKSYLSIQEIDNSNRVNEYYMKEISVEAVINRIMNSSITGIRFENKDQNKLKLYFESFVENGGKLFTLNTSSCEIAYIILKVTTTEITIIYSNISNKHISILQKLLRKMYGNIRMNYIETENMCKNKYQITYEVANENTHANNNENQQLTTCSMEPVEEGKFLGLLKVIDNNDGQNMNKLFAENINLQMILD